MFRYTFVNDTVYSTDDINDITKNLTGAGIAPFQTKDSYTEEDLNGLTAALTTSGTAGDSCRCTKDGNTVKIAEGILYFENGVTLTVDSAGYSVDVPKNSEGYVYAHFDTVTNTADIVFAEELPASGYHVTLAEVSSAGELTDRRTYARSRVPSFGAKTPLHYSVSGGTEYTPDINLSDYCYVMICPFVDSEGYGICGVFDIAANDWLFAGQSAYKTPKVSNGGGRMKPCTVLLLEDGKITLINPQRSYTVMEVYII